MTIFIIVSTIFMTAAATSVLHFLVKFASAWWQHQRMMTYGEEVQAMIVHVEVMDDENRSIPFVRMQVAVDKPGSVLHTAEGFYSRTDLPYLQVGNFVKAVLHPRDQEKLLLVKEQFTTRKPKETTAVLSIPPKRKLSVA